jgi:hypothetical protein
MDGKGIVDGRRTILVDMSDASTIDTEFLEHLGHTVIVCDGRPRERTPCILSVGSCPVAETADGIIFGLDLDHAPHRAVLALYRAVLRDGLPIAVATTPDRARRYASLLADAHVWTTTPRVADLDDFTALVEATASRQPDLV